VLRVGRGAEGRLATVECSWRRRCCTVLCTCSATAAEKVVEEEEGRRGTGEERWRGEVALCFFTMPLPFTSASCFFLFLLFLACDVILRTDSMQ
jgi:hypothetical protein